MKEKTFLVLYREKLHFYRERSKKLLEYLNSFGLGAASGIMKYLEERGIGLKVGKNLVPIAVGSCIFDAAKRFHRQTSSREK